MRKNNRCTVKLQCTFKIKLRGSQANQFRKSNDSVYIHCIPIFFIDQHGNEINPTHS